MHFRMLIVLLSVGITFGCTINTFDTGFEKSSSSKDRAYARDGFEGIVSKLERSFANDKINDLPGSTQSSNYSIYPNGSRRVYFRTIWPVVKFAGLKQESSRYYPFFSCSGKPATIATGAFFVVEIDDNRSDVQFIQLIAGSDPASMASGEDCQVSPSFVQAVLSRAGIDSTQ